MVRIILQHRVHVFKHHDNENKPISWSKLHIVFFQNLHGNHAKLGMTVESPDDIISCEMVKGLRKVKLHINAYQAGLGHVKHIRIL